ncbi:MAG: hypothetical protein K1X49_12625 [Saprospiraceae bacterium]|jgi:HPt (histidine-containing phosphotransfer) domain-containing protein|nr:hypothetical protein [Saprospiraceae bacterium]
MDTSIDLHLMRQIVFDDEKLLEEMIGEWIADTESRVIQMDLHFREKNQLIFKNLHDLKTNLSMISCHDLVQKCQLMIDTSVSTEKLMDEKAWSELRYEIDQLIEKMKMKIV